MEKILIFFLLRTDYPEYMCYNTCTYAAHNIDLCLLLCFSILLYRSVLPCITAVVKIFNILLYPKSTVYYIYFSLMNALVYVEID